jgi:hypothetical protein
LLHVGERVMACYALRTTEFISRNRGCRHFLHRHDCLTGAPQIAAAAFRVF